MKVANSYISLNLYQPNKTKKTCQNTTSSKNYYDLCFKGYDKRINSIGDASRSYIADSIINYENDNNVIEHLGDGSFGTAYKITLPTIGAIAVKILNTDNHNESYGGGNLEKEAEILKKIPYQCRQSQKLIDFFKYKDKDFLVTNYIPGASLKSQKNITQKQMDNIINELYNYDATGLMFYDLNADNIRCDDDNIGIFDFEFVEEKNPFEQNPSSFNDLHHIGRNLYHPQKSNICAFENRALGDFIIKSNEETSTEIVRKYLHSLSNYHSKMSTLLKKSEKVSDKAINYERILSNLYKNPNDDIISIEKDLIYLKSMSLNYYLYLIRQDNNALLEDDYDYYVNFDKYITNINQRAINVQNKINLLSKNKNPEIKEYCKVNSMYIDSLIKINCSKTSYNINENSMANKLKVLKEKIISNKEFDRIDEFMELYHYTQNEYSNNSDYLKYCNNIKDVFINTMLWLKENQ